MKGGHEGEVTAIEARGDAAEMDEFVEAAFDAVASFGEVVSARPRALSTPRRSGAATRSRNVDST